MAEDYGLAAVLSLQGNGGRDAQTHYAPEEENRSPEGRRRRNFRRGQIFGGGFRPLTTPTLACLHILRTGLGVGGDFLI